MKTTFPKRLEWIILVTIIILVVSVLVLLLLNMVSQYMNYYTVIELTLKSSSVNHAAVITYLQALDFATVKTSSLFISFLIVFVGGLYLLRVAESQFYLSVEAKNARATLSTTSPGLVMALFGVVLTIFSLQYPFTIEYKSLDKTGTTSSKSSAGPAGDTPLNEDTGS